MKNLLFSTTRQWNIGDEFILFGVRNILEEFYTSRGEKKPFNPIIYNRNPSITPVFHRSLSGYIKKHVHSLMAECDNSIHERIDAGFIDAAICAGTPEWRGERMLQFYKIVNQYKLPFLALGVGEIGPFNRPVEEDVIKNASILTFRSPKLAAKARQLGLNNAIYLPCPALLSIKPDEEKQWQSNAGEITIGLGFNIPREYTVPYIGISRETYDFTERLFAEVLKSYGQLCKFVGICHYVDELPYAIKFFSKWNIDVLYSYDARDYGEIYSGVDLLISSRVHGCGIAASLGIPSLGISHDERGDTINGFLAEVVTPKEEIKSCMIKIASIIDNADEKHSLLVEHKKTTLQQYVEILSKNAPFLKY